MRQLKHKPLTSQAWLRAAQLCVVTGMAFTFIFLQCPKGQAALYVETGIGLGQIAKGSALYPGIPAKTGYGLGTNLTFADALGSGSSLVQIHVGVQHRLTQGSSNGTSYALMSLYPSIRIETPRLYVGCGASPLLWKRQKSDSALYSGYTSVSGSLGYFGEVGLLWRVVPYFNLALNGSAEFVSTSGSLSPSPAMQISFNMRFFLGDGQSRGGGSGANGRKYDGWRYPFGISLF